MEMFKRYIEELHPGKSLVHNEKGFAIYWIREKGEVYIEDIYVEPAYRRSDVASKLADEVAEIAKKNKCTFMTGTVVPSAHNPTTSLKMMLGYGFEVVDSFDNIIWFKKKLI